MSNEEKDSILVNTESLSIDLVDNKPEDGIVAKDYSNKVFDEDAMVEYISGKAEAPEVLNSLMDDIIKKVVSALGCSVLSSFQRQLELNRYLTAVEDRLFDVDELQFLDAKALLQLHREAKDTYNNMLESARKFVAQNRETDVVSDKKDDLVAKLMSLSPEKIDKLFSMIEEEGDSKDKKENKKEKQSLNEDKKTDEI